MKNQETNTKPMGRPGPFPAFPCRITGNIPNLSSAVFSSLPISHEFYITQAYVSANGRSGPNEGIWIAPAYLTTPEQIQSNGTPLNIFGDKTQNDWFCVLQELLFMAGPYPKGHAVYIIGTNPEAEKPLGIEASIVIALDIYKDQNYPETRY